MRILKAPIAVLLLFILSASCSSISYPVGNFQQAPIVADGNASDWGLPLRFGTEDGHLQYNITNDNEHIYVSVATNDQATQARLLRAGISIFVDTKAKKNKSMGIQFPVRSMMNNDRPMMDRGDNRNRNMNQANARKQSLLDKNVFETFGFINMDNRIYDITDTNFIKMGINYDEFGNLF